MTSEERRRRMALSRLPNSKLSLNQQEELVDLELEEHIEALETFRQKVAARWTQVECNYGEREMLADQYADAPMPEPDRIDPWRFSTLLYEQQTALLQTGALARQARARYDELNSILDTLETEWQALTVETVEWRAKAAAAPVLGDLRLEVGRAKAHAAYCENAHEQVRSKIFALRWMMENYDRQHGLPSALRGPVDNQAPTEPIEGGL